MLLRQDLPTDAFNRRQLRLPNRHMLDQPFLRHGSAGNLGHM
jgi:hypothetical protein